MTGSISPNLPSKGEPLGTSDKRVRESLVTLRDGINGILNSENKVPGSSLAKETIGQDRLEKGLGALKWYEPKVIATEEITTSTSFTALGTADEIKSVVVPTNGLLVIGYQGLFKSSVGNAGKAAIFIGANQLKAVQREGAPAAQEASTETNGLVGNRWVGLSSTVNGLLGTAENADVSLGSVTTGLIVGAGGLASSAKSGLVTIGSLAAGTYAISVKFKATSGSVTAKERKLWAYVLGA